MPTIFISVPSKLILKYLCFRCNIPVADTLSDINACIKVRDSEDLYVGR